MWYFTALAVRFTAYYDLEPYYTCRGTTGKCICRIPLWTKCMDRLVFILGSIIVLKILLRNHIIIIPFAIWQRAALIAYCLFQSYHARTPINPTWKLDKLIPIMQLPIYECLYRFLPDVSPIKYQRVTCDMCLCLSIKSNQARFITQRPLRFRPEW